ncbi:MAG TPA: hypothetical protein VG943_15205 [Caulobacterales bacterium]|nr:hypothetical protein [Caulobacterales bacterium]
MKRAIAMALLASTLLAGLAAAQPAEHGGQPEVSSRSMDAPYLAVPVVRNGQLVNYLFVSVRFDISPQVDLWRTRERAQFLRDALVRAVHHTSLADPNDPNVLDQARAIQLFRQIGQQVLGENAIRNVSIISSYSNRGSTT